MTQRLLRYYFTIVNIPCSWKVHREVSLHHFKPKVWVKKAAVRGRVLRAAASLAGPSVVVLMYHSVVEDPKRSAKIIHTSHSRAAFESQMSALSRRFNPVSIEQVAEFAGDGRRLPPWSVAVTFDDGFLDNYHVALPILSRYGIPATFYIMVNAVETGLPPWYLRLNFAFSTTTMSSWKHPESGKTFEIGSAEGREAALTMAWELGAARSGIAQEQLTRQIEESLQIESLDERLMMNWDQIRALRKEGHIIGAHTLSHPNLAHVSEEDVRSEILGSKQRLEETLSEPIQHFSYPHPALNPQWNTQTMRITREAGFRSAVLTTPGSVLPGDEPLSLKRIPAAKTFDEWLWRVEYAFLGGFR
jgi:peptidoglycan/xylan/chitin deacetylase (PgdA/CDA1 family)